jgi:hypothetical protein
VEDLLVNSERATVVGILRHSLITAVPFRTSTRFGQNSDGTGGRSVIVLAGDRRSHPKGVAGAFNLSARLP